jgi:hypothetical protein
MTMCPTTCSDTSEPSPDDLQPPSRAPGMHVIYSTAGGIQSANAIVYCWNFDICVYRLNNGHLFALMGERMQWDVSMTKLYHDLPIALPILRRHRDLA